MISYTYKAAARTDVGRLNADCLSLCDSSEYSTKARKLKCLYISEHD